MVTTTLGGATFGNCEIGSVLIDKPPRNRMMIETTIASAGRWRNFENIRARFKAVQNVRRSEPDSRNQHFAASQSPARIARPGWKPAQKRVHAAAHVEKSGYSA